MSGVLYIEFFLHVDSYMATGSDSQNSRDLASLFKCTSRLLVRKKPFFAILRASESHWSASYHWTTMYSA